MRETDRRPRLTRPIASNGAQGAKAGHHSLPGAPADEGMFGNDAVPEMKTRPYTSHRRTANPPFRVQ